MLFFFLFFFNSWGGEKMRGKVIFAHIDHRYGPCTWDESNHTWKSLLLPENRAILLDSSFLFHPGHMPPAPSYRELDGKLGEKVMKVASTKVWWHLLLSTDCCVRILGSRAKYTWNLQDVYVCIVWNAKMLLYLVYRESKCATLAPTLRNVSPTPASGKYIATCAEDW